MRVKRGFVRHRRHQKVRARAKGYRGVRRATFVKAREALLKAGQYAYRDRRRKKREFRSLWILRLNAAAREHNLTYARFMKGLREKKIALNRKALSEIAIHHPEVFKKIVEAVGS